MFPASNLRFFGALLGSNNDGKDGGGIRSALLGGAGIINGTNAGSSLPPETDPAVEIEDRLPTLYELSDISRRYVV
jgi:hypothetical protein